MHPIGLLLMITGFSGVPCLCLYGLSEKLSISLVVHSVLVLSYLVYAVKKEGSFKAWLNQRTDSYYSVHPVVIVLIGILFTVIGIYIMIFGQPGKDPESMNLSEIIYFGAIFTLVGSGVFLVSLKDCLECKTKQPSEN